MKETWKTIDRIQDACELDDDFMAQILSMSGERYRIRRKNFKALDVKKVLDLIHHFDLDPDRFAAGEIDTQAMAKAYAGRADLPEKYLDNAFSRKRTAATIIQYVEEVFGKRESLRLLRRLQLPRESLNGLEELTNIRLVVDLCSEFSRRFGAENLFAVGKFSSNLNTTQALREVFSDCLTEKDVFEMGIDEVTPRYFDTNFNYEIEMLTDERCIIASRPSSKLKNVLKSNTPGTIEISLYRTGTFSAFPRFIGLGAGEARLISSIYEGSDACRHEIIFG